MTLPYYQKFICLGPVYLYMVYVTMLWVAETRPMNWKEHGRDCGLVIFRRQSGGTEKNHENISHDSQRPIRFRIRRSSTTDTTETSCTKQLTSIFHDMTPCSLLGI
jgi:hypothetical protein